MVKASPVNSPFRGRSTDGDEINRSTFGLSIFADDFLNNFGGDALLASAPQGDAADVWLSSVGWTEAVRNFKRIMTDASAEAGTASANLADDDAGVAAPVFIDASPFVVAEGASVEINGSGAQSVTFTGTTGTLEIDHSLGFTGQIMGLAGSDTLDLADLGYGAHTTATFLGDTSGGTLTVTDGTSTANITLVGNYLSSTWHLSSDGKGGTLVVDPISPNNWQPLKIGAGGWVTGMQIAPDGTMVARTDTYGAYVWNGTQWQQLVTSTSMPSAFVTPNNSQGVYEIQVAASNSNIMYMMYEGYVFKSINKGTTWTQTSFAPVSGADPNDANYKLDGQKMAIDPNNPNVVYVGTPKNGLFVTTDGGTSWQSVSSVPLSLPDTSGDNPGFSGIVFDPALGVTGGKTNTVFAASYGNGVYESTNGGASWSKIGGPSNVQWATVSSTGVYYAVNNQDTANSTLWSYQNGTWTQLYASQNGISTVAVNPSNPNEIVVTNIYGQLSISYNGGATWAGGYYNTQLVSTDIPWLATASTQAGSFISLSVGGTQFDPLVPNKLWISDGTGVVYTTDLPTSNFTSTTPVVWHDQSLGIEQLVANEIIVPPGGKPVLASWDRPFFYVNDPTTYSSTYSPNQGGKMVEGWSVDYASSTPSFIVGIADNGGDNEYSGYSTDGGQTWKPFATMIPGAGTSSFVGGTIAASTPTNIIWAPADGNQPYYTLDGGSTWNAINLPGVSSWSGFDYSQYFDARTVTADRVLSNTFYLYYAGQGVFKTTDGGVSWTEVFAGQISPWSIFNAELESVPGEAGNLFFTGGPQASFSSEPFMRSTDGGATWTAVPNVTEVNCFGFGAPAPGQSYPSIYIVGWVNNVYGIWQSDNNAQSWTQIGTYPTNSLDQIKTISGDPNTYGQVYVGFTGSGYAYLPAASAQTGSQTDTTPPTISTIAETPANGDLNAGKVVIYTITMSEAVTVNTTNGSPTLTMNTGGTATYVSGSGSSALTFSYTVSTGENTPDLMVARFNLNGAAITDGAGNVANLSLTGIAQGSPAIDTTAPAVTQVVASPGSGTELLGATVTLTMAFGEAVTVTGTPTLTLNDGGTATYTGGTGTNALVFKYTVTSADNPVSALAITQTNLPNGATITDGAGNAADLSGALTTFPGLAVDLRADQAPVVTTSIQYAGRNQTIAASTMFAATDPDGDPITTYLLKNETGDGHFVVNGIVQADNLELDLTPAGLGQTFYVAGSGSDQLSVQVSDGTLWSAWQTVTVMAPLDQAPVVTASDKTSVGSQNAAALLAQYSAMGFQAGTDSGALISSGQTAQITSDLTLISLPRSQVI